MTPLDVLRRAHRFFGRCLATGLLACASHSPKMAESPGPWQPIQVPGSWESQGPPSARSHDGFAWYRAWLKPHDSFFTKHERNLFEESVTLTVREVADAHEAFVNGKRVGGGGQFPPAFQSGRSGNHRYKVPPGTLQRGKWNEIAIRVYNREGPGGFLGEAPFIMDYFNECRMAGAWEIRLGDDPSWAGPALIQRPAAALFETYQESRGVLGEAVELVHGEKLSPEASARKFQAHPDFLMEQMLSEPLVAQPTHLSFDEKGRLWVAQYRQYPYPAGLKMLSRDKYYRAQYDKVPLPPPHHDRGRDRITIHEDTDGDGLFDRHKVFVDGLNMANAVVRGRGGVWIMNTPYLLFYPDADFDDVPDGPPVVHLAGFGLEDTHSVANGLVWGMDGWLYGGQGSTTSSRVTRPDLDPAGSAGVYYEGCMLWRYHPETRAYEIFAEGSGNTFGLEVDAAGRLFSGHNGGETRGWHYVQGGYYLKQGKDPGKFGPSRNPYTFGELPMMRPHSAVQRFSHLFAMGEGTALPPAFAGKLFAVDPLHGLVMVAERKLRGSTFETVDIGPSVSSADPAFRPVFIVNGADGALYIADFYEHYIAHGQHYQSQIDPTTGRIYRLRGASSKLEPRLNLTRMPSPDLVALLSHSNKWHRQTAVRVLGERRETSIVPSLLKRLETGPGALESLWVLHQMRVLVPPLLIQAMKHSEPPVRAWAVRLAGDTWGHHPGLGTADASAASPGFPAELTEALVERAGVENDSEVRSQIAATARRMPVAESLRALGPMLMRDADAADPFIPLLCWWVLERAASVDAGAALDFFEDPTLWPHALAGQELLPRLMRRFAMEGRKQDLMACARLFRIAPDASARTKLMKGFEEAYRGRALGLVPDELSRALAGAGGATLAFRLRQGAAGALDQALALLADSKASVIERTGVARTIGELGMRNAVPGLLALVRDRGPSELQRAALGALAAFDTEEIPRAVLALAPGMDPDVRGPALAMLSTRPRWSSALIQSIEEGKTPLTIIPAELSDRLARLEDPALRARALRLFPKVKRTGATSARVEAIKAALQSGPGDPYEGSKLFEQRCAACHKLFFKGGSIGPDLTPYQRDHLDTLLAAILEPSAEIREGYSAVEVETRDGRSLTGFVMEADASVTMMRTLEGETTLLRAEAVQRLQPMGRSLMPDGLIDDLSDKALRDFFAFLRASQPFSK